MTLNVPAATGMAGHAWLGSRVAEPLTLRILFFGSDIGDETRALPNLNILSIKKLSCLMHGVGVIR